MYISFPRIAGARQQLRETRMCECPYSPLVVANPRPKAKPKIVDYNKRPSGPVSLTWCSELY